MSFEFRGKPSKLKHRILRDLKVKIIQRGHQGFVTRPTITGGIIF